MQATTTASPASARIELPVEGMTCASCVNRIERFLKRTPGVEEAAVNLATEVATIRYLPDQVGRTELVGAIAAAGYDVRHTAAPAEHEHDHDHAALGARDATADDAAARARDARALLVRALVSIGVAIGIMAMMLAGRALPM